MSTSDDPADRLAREGRVRFPRWDDALWSAIVGGPASELARGLDAAGGPAGRDRPALDAFLALAAEAAGLGYLYPPSAGRDSVFTRAFFRWLPRGLPALAPERRAEVLASCWNLGENLETFAPWLQRIFLGRLPGDPPLERLEEVVARISTEVLEPPSAELGRRFRIHWVPLGEIDPLFLPGEVLFLTPTVVAVQDRQAGLEGLPRSAVGVRLGDPPEILGILPPQAAELSGEDLGELGEEAARRDPRITGVFSCSRNKWRAACTLKTSQFLVVFAPGG
jgi:hypothetical protein